MSMVSNSTVKQLLQVSEEAAPAVHMPIMVGNEVFIMTQQDVRRVEDVRLLTYQRMSPNGQLWPLTTHCASTAAPMFPGSLPMPASSPFCTLQQLVAHCQNIAKEEQSPIEECESEQPGPTVASIATQLNWVKQGHSSKPFPLRYSAATSTTALQANTSTQHTPRPGKCSNCSQTSSACPSASQTTNTSCCESDE